jgi:hypothetical protein
MVGKRLVLTSSRPPRNVSPDLTNPDVRKTVPVILYPDWTVWWQEGRWTPSFQIDTQLNCIVVE